MVWLEIGLAVGDLRERVREDHSREDNSSKSDTHKLIETDSQGPYVHMCSRLQGLLIQQGFGNLREVNQSGFNSNKTIDQQYIPRVDRSPTLSSPSRALH